MGLYLLGLMEKAINIASKFLQRIFREDIIALANILTAEASEDYDPIIDALDDVEYTVARLRDRVKHERDRKALEAQNTEFDCGHNVKHYSEEI